MRRRVALVQGHADDARARVDVVRQSGATTLRDFRLTCHLGSLADRVHLRMLLNVVVHPANIQDRDGAALVLDQRTRALFPFIQVLFADGGYQGEAAAAKIGEAGTWRLEIVKRSDQAKGFVVLPKRWRVERTLSWLTRCRRIVRHYEQYLRTSVAFIRLAMIRLMLRRLART